MQPPTTVIATNVHPQMPLVLDPVKTRAKRNTPVTNIKKIPFTPTKHDPRYRDNKATTAQLGIFPNGLLLELAQALGLVMNKAGVVRPTHLAIREGYMAYARSADGKSNKMFYTNKGIRYIKEYQHHIPK